MSNVNSFSGEYNLPKMIVSDTNEHALTVPTLATTPSGVTWAAPYYSTALSSAGNPYPGLPSPQLPVNSGLTISFPPDVAGSMAVDGHPFKIKLACVVANPGGGNVTVKMYQVPFASLGVISASGSVTTAGAPGSGDNIIKSAGVALTTPPSTATAFYFEHVCLWDSSSLILQNYYVAYYTATATGTLVSPTAGTNVTAVANVAALNFLPSFTFATGNAANAVTVQEFSLERY